MAQFAANRTIDAPADRVFETVAHIENFQRAVPHITNVEFLTESHTGIGTRFRETRLMRGREVTTELEVTEYEPNQRVRLVSDAGGTVWDTMFTVRDNDGESVVSLLMDARPYKLTARVMNRVISRMIRKGIEGDLDGVKAYCEGGGE
jgi:uncharacterized membrane protein